MLILARTVGQSIIIDDNTEIKILDVRGGQIRLGITAPRKVSVYRKEIWLQIQMEKQKEEES